MIVLVARVSKESKALHTTIVAGWNRQSIEVSLSAQKGIADVQSHSVSGQEHLRYVSCPAFLVFALYLYSFNKIIIMTCELSKMDLWRLLKGTEPPTYEWIAKLEKLGLGSYSGGFSDRWEYKGIFDIPENLGEEEMWELYKQMREESEALWKRIGIV